MKRIVKILSVVTLFFCAAVAFVQFGADANADGSGAPSGSTGSPGDGNTCAASGCHTGSTPVSVAGLITSDIPGTGYVAGQTYTITASISTSGRTKYGFEISPQNTSGTKLGTLAVISSTTTQLKGSSKYVTHKSAGNSFPSGTATWSFHWTAPAAGTGDVTFYGAFNSANGNNSASGDIISLSTLLVSESVSSGVADINAFSNKISVYPNPFTDNISLKSELAGNDNFSLSIMDTNGKLVKQLNDVNENQLIDLHELANGYYVCRIETAKGVAIKKLNKN